MYTYEYDATYLPSMPVVDVAVSRFSREPKPIMLRAIIDSGSDGSMIPLSILKQINARRSSQAIFRSITGASQIADIYEVSLQVGPHTFHKVRVVADRHNSMMILGRDILNHLVVTLNGLAATTELHE